MKKVMFALFLLIIISLTACQAPKKDVVEKESGAIQKPVEDAAVNSVGSGINNVDSVDNDLNSDELSGIDSGLTDIENI